MKNPNLSPKSRATGPQTFPSLAVAVRLLAALFALAFVSVAPAVRADSPSSTAGAQAKGESESQALHPGDVLKISFPGSPTLDTTQQIRRDGKINLYLVGEVTAAGLSPSEVEKQLVQLYSSQIVSKEVRVTVISSAFAVFVTGAVLHPGKLTPERNLTAFEAIMEAGGFNTATADTKAVVVIRNEGGRTKRYKLNLKSVIQGDSDEPFYLQAYDVVYVPERFSWF